MKSKNKTAAPWSFKNAWLFAIFTRLIASFTHSHWFHPDEWCQTLEPANYLARGIGYYSQEIGLHLRNLSWASLLAAVLKICQWICPDSIAFRVHEMNLFCGALDLLILWGWIQLLELDPLVRKTSQTLKNWSLVLLLFPWFTYYGAISPRGEHLSEIAFWVALGCLARQFWFAAGVASVAIFAFRYPSGLLSLGIALSVLSLARFESKKLKILGQHGLGLLTGFILFGLCDWAVYGRFWESFWMYLQYNIFTGTGAKVFGRQGISAYKELFLWDWFTYKAIIPLGLFLMVSSFYGFFRGLKKIQPWAICLILYLIGHFLVPHKEGRFMIPIETLTRWSAFVGVVLLSQSIKKIPASLQTTMKGVLWATLGVNLVLSLHAIRADLWKDRGTYLELDSHLRASSRPTCAILTVRDVNSILMPYSDPHQFPQPAVGSFKTFPELLDFEHTKEGSIEWIEHAPTCQAGDEILLQVHKAEQEWKKGGCALQASGILRLLPESAWDWAIRKKFAAGSWYRCPATVLEHFQSQSVSHFYTQSFGKIEKLPRLGTSSKQLIELGQRTSMPPSSWPAELFQGF